MKPPPHRCLSVRSALALLVIGVGLAGAWWLRSTGPMQAAATGGESRRGAGQTATRAPGAGAMGPVQATATAGGGPDDVRPGTAGKVSATSMASTRAPMPAVTAGAQRGVLPTRPAAVAGPAGLARPPAVVAAALGPAADTPEAPAWRRRSPRHRDPAAVRRYGNTALPLRLRQRDLVAQARRGDAATMRSLMAIGDSDIYLAPEAICALAELPFADPAIGVYLRDQLHQSDHRLVCAAATTLARTEGDAATDALTDLLRRSHARRDGWRREIQRAAVAALRHSPTPRALPTVERELHRVAASGRELEHGSRLVALVADIATPAAVTVLENYRNALMGRRPGDPLAGGHFDAKIAEVDAAISALQAH